MNIKKNTLLLFFLGILFLCFQPGEFFSFFHQNTTVFAQQDIQIKNLSFTHNANRMNVTWLPFGNVGAEYRIAFIPTHVETNQKSITKYAPSGEGEIVLIFNKAGLYKIETEIRDKYDRLVDYGPIFNMRVDSIANDSPLDLNKKNPKNGTDNNETPTNDNDPNQQDPNHTQNNTSNTQQDLLNGTTTKLSDAQQQHLAALLGKKKPDYEVYNNPDLYEKHSIFIDIPAGVSPEEFFAQLKQKYGNDITISQPFLSLGILTYRVSFTNTTKKNSELLQFLDPYVVDKGGHREWPIIYKIVQNDDAKKKFQKGYLKESGILEAITECPPAGKKVKVAVIDNAFDVSHKDFGNHIIYKYDMADKDDDISPPVEQNKWIHGTVSASIIGADSFNEIGIVGSSLNSAELMLFKATSNNSVPGDITAGIEAMTEAVKQGAEIINISRGAPIYSKVHKNVINKVLEKGVIIVASAGNYNKPDPFFPAAYPGVISVASVNDISLDKSKFSNYGDWVSLASYGENIQGLGFDQGIGKHNGTSESAPFVAGMLAFLKSQGKDLSDISYYLIPYNSIYALGKGVFDITGICRKDHPAASSNKGKTFSTQQEQTRMEKHSKIVSYTLLIVLFGWLLYLLGVIVVAKETTQENN